MACHGRTGPSLCLRLATVNACSGAPNAGTKPRRSDAVGRNTSLSKVLGGRMTENGLQDPVERDLVDKPTFERLLSERGIANDTTLVLYGDGAARLRDRQELRRLVDGVGQPRRRSDRKGFLDDDRISGQSSRRVCHKTNESRSDLRGKRAALSAAKLLLSPDRAAASAAASFVSGGSWWPSHPRWEERTNQIRALPSGNNTNR